MLIVTPPWSSGGTVAVGAGLGLDAYFYLPAPQQAPVVGLAPLLIIAEPVEFAPGHAECTRAVIESLVAGLATAEAAADPSLTLCRLLGAANTRLCAENAARDGRALHLGLSCVIRVGRELAVAQAAPTQVLVRHEGLLDELPSLAGWTGGDIPDTADLTPCGPLGWRPEFEPALSYIPAGPGTLALGLSSTLAQSLACQSGQLLLRSRPEELSGRLERWLQAEDLHWAHAAVAWVDGPRAARRPATIGHRFGRAALDAGNRNGQTEKAGAGGLHNVVGGRHELPSRPGAAVGARTAGPPVEPFVTRAPGVQSREDRVVTRSSTIAGAQQLVIRAEGERFSFTNSQPVTKQSAPVHRNAGPAQPRTVRRGPVELLAALLVGLTAAVVSVWRISHSSTNRPIHGPRDDGTLGLPHLQRWSDGPKARRFEGARRVAPRFEFSRLILVAAVLLVVVVGGFFAYNRFVGDRSVDGAELESRLADVINLHAQANNAGDPALAYELLLDAQARAASLAGAFVAGAEVDPRVLEQQQSIATELEQLTKQVELTAVQVVGNAPPPPEGVNAQLFGGGGRIYLLSDALYQVDVTGQSLVRLLAPGDLVGDQAVGKLLAATWRDDGPYVVDGAAGYVFDISQGSWRREALGASPQGAPQVSAIAIFDYNLYVLEAELGRILKYVGGDYEAPPEDWSRGLEGVDFTTATDMVVDGNIYVGLADGSILHLYLSSLQATFAPQTLPPVESAAALAAAPGVSAFYIVNESDGRILKLDPSGQLLQQYQPGPDLPSFEGITDLVVDEGTGIAYVLVGDAIYATRLTPGEGLPAATPTTAPEATPAAP